MLVFSLQELINIILNLKKQSINHKKSKEKNKTLKPKRGFDFSK